MNERDVYIAVIMTTANVDEADRVASALVEERLAACVNVVPGCKSFYSWKGQLTEDKECLLIAKTRAAVFDDLERRVRELHGYEVPEIVAIPLVALSTPYRAFLEAGTAPSGPPSDPLHLAGDD